MTLRAPTRTTRTVYQAATGLLDQWLSANASTPVRLLGVGVSKFEEGSAPLEGDLDETIDDITERYGGAMLTRGLALGPRDD